MVSPNPILIQSKKSHALKTWAGRKVDPTYNPLTGLGSPPEIPVAQTSTAPTALLKATDGSPILARAARGSLQTLVLVYWIKNKCGLTMPQAWLRGLQDLQPEC